jgi:peroxiredoxin
MPLMRQSLSQKLADITLPDSAGQQLRLGSLWADRPAVIVFLRHYGCIFCREHIAQLRDHEQSFRNKGASLAAIGLGDMRYAQIFRADSGITFPLLIDEKRLAYRATGLRNGSLLHLLRQDNTLARKRARAAGHRQRGLGKNPFQLGGSFVFGPGNIDLYTHVSRTFGDNASPGVLLDAIPRPD